MAALKLSCNTPLLPSEKAFHKEYLSAISKGVNLSGAIDSKALGDILENSDIPVDLACVVTMVRARAMQARSRGESMVYGERPIAPEYYDAMRTLENLWRRSKTAIVRILGTSETPRTASGTSLEQAFKAAEKISKVPVYEPIPWDGNIASRIEQLARYQHVGAIAPTSQAQAQEGRLISNIFARAGIWGLEKGTSSMTAWNAHMDGPVSASA